MPNEIKKLHSGRLLLVSNRLPITIKRSDDGAYSFSMSSGGLVTGLSGLSKTTSFQWYGWPGLEVPESEIDRLTDQLKDEYGATPIFIDDELADRHYNGFSSTWPPKLEQRLKEDLSLTCDDYRLYSLAALPLPSRRNHIR
jgi:trehalose-6-phosphate synthase